MRKLTDLGARLFSFAVIADTHVNQEEGKASSDFAVNRLSNARNRRVIEELRRRKPAFVLHLGDIVHPTPRHPDYALAAQRFRELAARLECPLYLTPGNHDVGDKPGNWLPVPSVSDEYLAAYEREFGARFQSFDNENCHFIVIDAQVINSGLQSEAAQREWLERDLAANASKRIFLCTHYPPFLFEPGEDGHYDNIDEPGRSWLLELLAQHRVEALFAGHVHNFWYHLHGDTEIYLLPSTAFVRLDYSELYRIEPGPERGRNDAPKLGFLIVDVHEHGHVAHAIRTYGECLAPGEALPQTAVLPPVHPKLRASAPLGIDLRYPWAERTEVVASGALDEFSRKPARNDYPVMALWEMGIRRLRVPVSDLRDPATRERMRALRRNGHEFTVYSHSVPTDSLCGLLLEHHELVSVWEMIAPLREAGLVAQAVARVKKSAPILTCFSKLQRPDDAHHHGLVARHTIEHGFHLAERALLGELRDFDGFVFRVSSDACAWKEILDIDQAVRARGKRGFAYVRLAASNPAQAREDDLANANHVAEAGFAAFACPDVEVWLDTLNDVDRGYYPRSGLVDRRYNPRLAGHVCRNLHSALCSATPRSASIDESTTSFGRILVLQDASGPWLLILPQRAGNLAEEDIPAAKRDLQWIDLASGRVDLNAPAQVAAPMLVLPRR